MDSCRFSCARTVLGKTSCASFSSISSSSYRAEKWPITRRFTCASRVDLCGLPGSGMLGLPGTCRIGAGKGRFVEQQVYSLYLFGDGGVISGIRAIGIRARRVGRRGQPVIGNGFPFFRNEIFSVLMRLII